MTKPAQPPVSRTADTPELLVRVGSLLREIGFDNVNDFRNYMRVRSVLNQYDAVCYTEIRGQYTLNHSDNCLRVFGIGTMVRGIWNEVRFN